MKCFNPFIEGKREKSIYPEHEVKAILREMGISVPRGFYAEKGTSLSDIVERASLLSYPLVAKVSSPLIPSKTDVGGVRTGIRDEESLKRAIIELFDIKESEGVLVEEMVPEGLEVIVGGVIDEQFGPIMMFGIGGVFVEIFRDVAFGLSPLKKEDALWMIGQIKAYPLLKGYRGSLPVDIDTLADLMVSISEVMAKGNIKEIDLNPVVLYPKGAIVVDAKMKI